MEEELRFTQSLGKWEVALAVFQAMVKRDPDAAEAEFCSKTRMGSTISIALYHPGGWNDDVWSRIQDYAQQIEQQYPGLILLPEKG